MFFPAPVRAPKDSTRKDQSSVSTRLESITWAPEEMWRLLEVVERPR